MSKGQRVRAERLLKPKVVRRKEMLEYMQRLRDKSALSFEYYNKSTIDEAWHMNTLIDLRDDNLAAPLSDGAL